MGPRSRWTRHPSLRSCRVLSARIGQRPGAKRPERDAKRRLSCRSWCLSGRNGLSGTQWHRLRERSREGRQGGLKGPIYPRRVHARVDRARTEIAHARRSQTSTRHRMEWPRNPTPAKPADGIAETQSGPELNRPKPDRKLRPIAGRDQTKGSRGPQRVAARNDAR